MLEPKEIEIEGKKYIITKIPAVQGREILTQYPITAMPKIGQYKANEELMFKMMKYVYAISEGKNIRLETQELINNQVKSWEVLAQIEKEMVLYNCSFFTNGGLSSFLSDITQKGNSIITKILTGLLERSSVKEKQPSMNSEQSTH